MNQWEIDPPDKSDDPAEYFGLRRVTSWTRLFRHLLGGRNIIGVGGIKINYGPDRIQISLKQGATRGSGATCQWWRVSQITVDDVPKLKIRCTTIGGKMPTNFASLFDVDLESADPVYFVADCTMSNGAVESVTLRAEQSSDVADIDAEIPAQVGTPPSSCKFVVARWLSGQSCGFTNAINVTPTNTWDQAATSPSPGAAAYLKWWSYTISDS